MMIRTRTPKKDLLLAICIACTLASLVWSWKNARRDPIKIADSWGLINGFPTVFVDRAAIEQFTREAPTQVQFVEFGTQSVAIVREGVAGGAFWEEVVIYAKDPDYWRKCAEFNSPRGAVKGKTVGSDLLLIDGEDEKDVLATIPWNRLGE